MAVRRASLADSLLRLPRHDSTGSGIINWTDWEAITFHDLIYCLLVYSDCVATNMLIDYIGSQSKINRWLQAQGLPDASYY